MFDACVAIVRKEAGTAQFLLPHVVLAVLTCGDAGAIADVDKERWPQFQKLNQSMDQDHLEIDCNPQIEYRDLRPTSP